MFALSDTEHDECTRPGKYDCRADEYVSDITMDEGSGEGHVESPVAWFAGVTLSDAADQEYVEHYGTCWLIAREGSDGRFWVERYDTEEARDERLEGLRQGWAEWAGEEL